MKIRMPRIVTLDRADHIPDLTYMVVEFLGAKMRTHQTPLPELVLVEIYDIPSAHERKEIEQYIMTSATNQNAGYWELP